MSALEKKPVPLQRWENEGGQIVTPNEGVASSLEAVYTQSECSEKRETKVRTFETRHGLDPGRRRELVALLNQQLADCFDLYSQTKQAHWNVKGLQFYQLHLLFDTLAGQLLGYVDLLAERATALGGTALGTARIAAKTSRVPEYPLEAVGGRQHLEALAERFAVFGSTARAALRAAEEHGDAVTADLLTQVSSGVDKALWFLESHLQS